MNAGNKWDDTLKQVIVFPKTASSSEVFRENTRCLDIDVPAKKVYGCTTGRLFRCDFDGGNLESFVAPDGNMRLSSAFPSFFLSSSCSHRLLPSSSLQSSTSFFTLIPHASKFLLFLLSFSSFSLCESFSPSLIPCLISLLLGLSLVAVDSTTTPSTIYWARNGTTKNLISFLPSTSLSSSFSSPSTFPLGSRTSLASNSDPNYFYQFAFDFARKIVYWYEV